jgi:hypothetical protein
LQRYPGTWRDRNSYKQHRVGARMQSAFVSYADCRRVRLPRASIAPIRAR